jgi:Ca2+-binding EF-hand superfamily protein
LRCISSQDDNDDDEDQDIKRQNLQALVIRAWVQKQKADLVFDMLDEAGKGVVVVEDLQLVAAEYLSDDIKDESDLVAMIQEVDQSGDGILTRDDFYRIASQILL